MWSAASRETFHGLCDEEDLKQASEAGSMLEESKKERIRLVNMPMVKMEWKAKTKEMMRVGEVIESL